MPNGVEVLGHSPNGRVVVAAAVVAAAMLLAACGTNQVDDLEQQVIELEQQVAELEQTTTTPDKCSEATDAMIGWYEVLFNRNDVDPEGVAEEMTDDGTLGTQFVDLGTTLASSCSADLGAGMSEVAMYLAREVTEEHSAITTPVIDSFLQNFCEPDDRWTLTVEARAACASK